MSDVSEMSDVCDRPHHSLWHRISGPVKIGIIFGLIGIILATIGMLQGFAPMTFRSFAMALLISGISWGVVSWAIAAAVVEVERDVQEAPPEPANSSERPGHRGEDHAGEASPTNACSGGSR